MITFTAIVLLVLSLFTQGTHWSFIVQHRHEVCVIQLVVAAAALADKFMCSRTLTQQEKGGKGNILKSWHTYRQPLFVFVFYHDKSFKLYYNDNMGCLTWLAHVRLTSMYNADSVHRVSCMPTIADTRVQCISFIWWFNMIFYFKRKRETYRDIQYKSKPKYILWQHRTFHIPLWDQGRRHQKSLMTCSFFFLFFALLLSFFVCAHMA